MRDYYMRAIIAFLLGSCLTFFGIQLYKTQQTFSQTERPIAIYISPQQEKNLNESAVNQLVKELRGEFYSNFDKTINHLNFTISFFTSLSALFLIFVGFFSFKKIKDLSELIEKNEKLPQVILKNYYANELSKLMSLIFDKNDIVRSEAIRSLSNNPEITNDKYSIVLACLEAENSKKYSPSFYSNMSYLVTILLKLDENQALNDIFSIFEKLAAKPEAHQAKIYIYMPHVVRTKLPEQRQKLLELILGSEISVYMSLVNNLFQADAFDDFFLDGLIKNADDQKVVNVLSQSISHSKSFDESSFLPAMQSRGVSQQLVTLFCNTKIRDLYSPHFRMELYLSYFAGRFFAPNQAPGVLLPVIEDLKQHPEVLDLFLERLAKIQIDKTFVRTSLLAYQQKDESLLASKLSRLVV